MYSGTSWGGVCREEVAEEIHDDLFTDAQDIKESSSKNTTLKSYGDSITIFGGTSNFR